MTTPIIVTKVACAYVELEHDTPVILNADLIIDMIPAEKGIGSAIIFLSDNTSINATETIHEIEERVRKRKHYFWKEFSKN